MISGVPHHISHPPAGTAGPVLRAAYGTDRGLRRELNEDSFIAQDPVFAVADGMGGHAAGEVASGTCVRILARLLAEPEGNRNLNAERVQAAVQEIDKAIRALAEGMAGTTLSGAVVVEQSGKPYWLVFNVGDSRTYRFSRGALEQITVDHSEVQELMDRGVITAEQAIRHPRRNVVTRALGSGDDTAPDFWLLPMEEGDRLLVCSDGLTGELRDEELATVLDRIPAPEDAVTALIQAALRHGGRDNVSVILVDVCSADPQVDTVQRADAELDQTLPRHLMFEQAPAQHNESSEVQ